MNNLKRKIQYLERELNADKSMLTQQSKVLIDYMHTTNFLYPAMLGSFAVGWFIAHKPNVEATKGKLRSLPGFVATFVKNVQLVLPLLL